MTVPAGNVYPALEEASFIVHPARDISVSPVLRSSIHSSSPAFGYGRNSLMMTVPIGGGVTFSGSGSKTFMAPRVGVCVWRNVPVSVRANATF